MIIACIIVTADQREGNEGKYRVGFSATPEYDPDDILINPGSATVEEVRTALTGLNDGSLVVGERGLERAQTSKNAPASDGSAKIEQTPAEIANEAQRAENAGEASLRHDLPDEKTNVDPASVTEEDVRTLLDRAKRKEYKDGSYIPVRANTPRVLIEAAADNGHTLRNVPFMMQVLKARQAMATPLEWAREGHFDSDAHDLTMDEIINIIYAMDSPKEIIYQSEDGRYVEVVEFEKQTGEKAVAVIEVGESKSPNYLNGYKGGIFQILVTAFGRNNEYIDSLSNKKGNKKVYPKKGKGASQSGSGNSVPSHLNDSPFANSIPQNGEKSTDLNEKVSENVSDNAPEGASDNDSKRSALPKTREAKERKRKRAQEHQRQSREKRKAERMAEAMREEVVRNAENVEVNAEQGTEAAQETVEKAKIPARGYTDAEANDARALVKDFDLLPASTRRAIVELMRSGKASGASENFKRHSANLIAYWRKGLWIIADSKTRDDGFYYVLDDGTRLITVNPKREAKAVSETLMHELAHDVWARADAKIRKTLYDLATAGVKKEEINEIREQYRTELTNRGELTKRDADGNTVDMTEAEINALLDEEVATNLLGETIGTEEFLSRFDGEGKFAAAKRIWRTLYNMKKRFTGKDKYLYRKADDLFKQFTKVMAVEEVEGLANESSEKNPRIRHSLQEIVGDSGKKYGIGVYLDSTLLTNLTDDERVQMVKEYVKELGGNVFTAYDGNNNAVNIHLVESKRRFKNKSGQRVPVNKDLSNKNIRFKTKQESIALVDELIIAAKYTAQAPSLYSHGWLDNYGANDWEYWVTYVKDKENTIWEATLNVATSENGEKILYDINPIKMVEQSISLDTSTTIVEEQPRTMGTSTTNNSIAEKTALSTPSTKKFLEMFPTMIAEGEPSPKSRNPRRLRKRRGLPKRRKRMNTRRSWTL